VRRTIALPHLGQTGAAGGVAADTALEATGGVGAGSVAA